MNQRTFFQLDIISFPTALPQLVVVNVVTHLLCSFAEEVVFNSI